MSNNNQQQSMSSTVPLLPPAHEKPLVPAQPTEFDSKPLLTTSATNGSVNDANSEPVKPQVESAPPQQTPTASSAPPVVTDIKLADLEVPLSSIKPGSIPPLTVQDSDEGVSIVLHFGKDKPRDYVTATVVTIINKTSEPMSDFELKAVVPKGCKVKLQAASGKELPPHNPFVPPSAITQVMLIANPQGKAVSLKYVLSYLQDGEPQTEMGQVDKATNIGGENHENWSVIKIPK